MTAGMQLPEHDSRSSSLGCPSCRLDPDAVAIAVAAALRDSAVPAVRFELEQAAKLPPETLAGLETWSPDAAARRAVDAGLSDALDRLQGAGGAVRGRRLVRIAALREAHRLVTSWINAETQDHPEAREELLDRLAPRMRNAGWLDRQQHTAQVRAGGPVDPPPFVPGPRGGGDGS